MNSNRTRVLYLPNETEFPDGRQRGPHRALWGLLDADLVQDVQMVGGVLHRERKGCDGPAERARELEIIREFQPTIVYFPDPGGTRVTSRDLDAWRSAADSRLHPRETRIGSPHSHVRSSQTQWQRMSRLPGC